MDRLYLELRQWFCVTALMVLAACSPDVRVHPESAMIAVEFARTDTRINKPVGVSFSFTPKFEPGVVMSEGCQIPFALDSTKRRMTTAASLHGVAGVFVLGTAARHTLVSPALLDKALPPTHTVCPVELVSGGITQQLECVPVFALALGGAVYTNFDVVVSTFDAGIDGVIGANILFAQPLTVDFRQHRLMFELPADAASWNSVRCALERGVPTVPLEVDGVAMACTIDTCAPVSTLPRSLYKGTQQNVVAKPESVLLGGVSIKYNTTFIINDSSTATLGLDFIERYALAFDLRSRTLYFRPVPNGGGTGVME